jgi:hypothetical protein
MSKDQDKIKHSTRLLKDKNAVNKQIKIAKEHGIPIITPHKFVKHHSMNCGNPKCILCSNPRKIWGDKTIQEKRNEQRKDDE